MIIHLFIYETYIIVYKQGVRYNLSFINLFLNVFKYYYCKYLYKNVLFIQDCNLLYINLKLPPRFDKFLATGLCRLMSVVNENGGQR